MQTFTPQDQELFAAFSGDSNPMHMDPLAARRMLYGHPVVHGMHVVLRAMDTLVPGDDRFSLTSIRVRFHAPLFVGEDVSLEYRQAEDTHRIIASSDGERITDVELVLTPPAEPAPPLDTRPPQPKCRELTASTIEAQPAGDVAVRLDAPLARELFPRLAARLDPRQLASLAALSQLVGMHMPGLRSIFSGFTGKFHASGEDGQYELLRFDDRFSFAEVGFTFPGLAGTVQAFLRPKPVAQPSCETLAGLVHADEFAHLKALVVGGSRGVGEVTAKLLAAGGADVRLTYHRGEGDAQRVCAEIAASGGNCAPFHHDVLAPDAGFAGLADGWRPNGLFYYPTPPIFQARRGIFSPDLFRLFCRFYVDGFQALVDQLPKDEDATILYPSSVAVDDPPPDMGEYAAAKAAGETLCAFLNTARKHLTIHCPRLPRLLTDQTTSLAPVTNHDPVEVLLPLLRTHFTN